MPTLARTLLVFPLLLACAEVSPPVSECSPSNEPMVALGFGSDRPQALERDAEATQVFGPQGGSHLLVGATLTGFEGVLVARFEARDAFTNGLLGASQRTLAPRRYPDSDVGRCEVRDTLLVLNGLFRGGAGLATVSVFLDDGNRRAAASQRVWIGRRQAACAPAEGVTPSMILLSLVHPTQRREEAVLLRADDTLYPVSNGEALVGVGTVGFAASAVSLDATLAEVTPTGRRTLRELRTAPAAGEVTIVPVLRRAGSECVSPATLRIPVDASTLGRPLVLVLRGDDGLGHSLTVERTLRLAAL